ncbi:hypothetical protein [Paraferrimonas haliotis]|uniref:Uncharacterized protein n=1 Tax=Paraferrimonas haliotis TaxID=2013866 RepID=A0AA37U297_9GAMM|nr:hypothetical protein [Paraferrimonas haliotis]GLS85001.1 hypothetical protein GCM10007894_29780 [Paraferrimonas haliotis]
MTSKYSLWLVALLVALVETMLFGLVQKYQLDLGEWLTLFRFINLLALFAVLAAILVDGKVAKVTATVIAAMCSGIGQFFIHLQQRTNQQIVQFQQATKVESASCPLDFGQPIYPSWLSYSGDCSSIIRVFEVNITYWLMPLNALAILISLTLLIREFRRAQ